MNREAGPGVPEALPRVVQGLSRRLEVSEIDRLWLFPPLVRGRREWGLIAASCFAEGRRRIFTAPYEAERNGRGLYLSWTLEEQGEAPADRLPRVMDGVVRRSHDELGDPREVEVAGELEALEGLISEYDEALFEEEAQPLEQVNS